jgi:putative DNA primase/helicase
VERKNKTSVEARFDIPVLLTMNAFPIIRDSSDAVYNRTLVLPMTSSTAEKDSREIAREVIGGELSGVLNWAIAGWRRLRDRGWFDPPPVMQAAVAEFKGQNNPFADFSSVFLVKSERMMVLRHDLIQVFNAWYKVEFSNKEWSGHRIAKALRGTIDGVIGDDTSKGRVWVGIGFTEAANLYIESEFGAAKRSVVDLNMGVTRALAQKHGIKIGTKF